MSRLPPLEHAFGRDRLARIHRVVGFLSFDLMLVHIGFIIAGYASGRWSAVPATTWDLFTNYGGVLLSVAGMVCLVMVVVTSSSRPADAAVRVVAPDPPVRLPRRRPRSAPPAVDRPGVPPLTGGDRLLVDAVGGGGRSGAGLADRTPLGAVSVSAAGSAVVRESSDVVSVYLTGRRLVRLPVRAGQFLNVRFLDSPGWTRANPFSLSAAPDGRSLRITAKALGEGSARLAHLQPGTRVLFEGPYGRLSSRARTRRKMLLAGAGVGITPLRGLAEGLEYAPGEAILLHRYTDEPLFVGEFDSIAQRRACRFWRCPGRDTPGSSSARPPATTSSRPAVLDPGPG